MAVEKCGDCRHYETAPADFSKIFHLGLLSKTGVCKLKDIGVDAYESACDDADD